MSGPALPPVAHSWFRQHTYYEPSDDLHSLLDRKRAGGSRISVCLPALNEAATIGEICRRIDRDLVAPGLVDELVVIDSGSVDSTADDAASAGATVYATESILPELPPVPGKGDALWRSLAVIQGDLVCYLDADVTNFDPTFVLRLVEPLLVHPGVALIKAFYERPLGSGGIGGGRVTELVARPLLNLFYPQLTGIIQPLAGEYAARVDVLKQLPFLCGYAVEIGLLIDVLDRFGLDALAQVDLGTRVHRNRPTAALGPMAFEITKAVLSRIEQEGRAKFDAELVDRFASFEDIDGKPHPAARDVTLRERPPMNDYSAGESSAGGGGTTARGGSEA